MQQQIYQKSLFHDDLEGAGVFFYFPPLTFGDMRPQSHLLGLFCLGPLEACSGLPNYRLPSSLSLPPLSPSVDLMSFCLPSPLLLHFFFPSSLASTHFLQQLPNFFPSPLKIASQRQRERENKQERRPLVFTLCRVSVYERVTGFSVLLLIPASAD